LFFLNQGAFMRTHFARIPGIALIAGASALVACGTAMAVTNVAGGNLDLNSGGLPRLAPDTCVAMTRVDAKGRSNFPAAFRLFRDGVPGVCRSGDNRVPCRQLHHRLPTRQVRTGGGQQASGP
jgi:hypothetical protein